jgi:formylglycine-generating enzyme required for sulfatase activity
MLTQPFQMAMHEITQRQFEQVMGSNPSRFKGADNPVEQVSWGDAVKFCDKLSNLPKEKSAGHVYRLPTETEWEYACRAGMPGTYSFGDSAAQFGDYAWYGENSATTTLPASQKTTHHVGQKKPNSWGLFDMHGNVWEWCQDWYEDYPSGSVTDPNGPASGSIAVGRVHRGGSWYSLSDDCRSAIRHRVTPVTRDGGLGFRVVCEIPPKVIATSQASTTQPRIDTISIDFDLRSDFGSQPKRSNAKIYAQSNGKIMFWAPERIGEPAEIEYVIPLNGRLEGVESQALGTHAAV